MSNVTPFCEFEYRMTKRKEAQEKQDIDDHICYSKLNNRVESDDVKEALHYLLTKEHLLEGIAKAYCRGNLKDAITILLNKKLRDEYKEMLNDPR